MGQSNAAVRQWMGNPKRFADLFNATVFNGEQVIRPEELEPVDGEEDILLTDKNGEYSCAAEPPVRGGVSHLSRRNEPL